MRLRGLSGKHCTIPFPGPRESPLESKSILNGTSKPYAPKLLVWSAADSDGVDRIVKSYLGYIQGAYEAGRHSGTLSSFLHDLAYTLDTHRTHLQWRSFAILQSPEDLHSLSSQISPPVKARKSPMRIGFVFTGQGAQWCTMGKELLAYPFFKAELENASAFLQTLGCRWNVIEELLKTDEESCIDDPEYSQTLCTVLQVVIVDLLRRVGVHPSAVVGHSSGEIAAAYAGGYLSRQSAWKLAYMRGICSAEIAQLPSSCDSGAMLSAALSEEDALSIASSAGVTVACINSPQSVTLSGKEELIDQVKTQLDGKQIFARKLRVSVAYHSPQVENAAEKYESMVGTLTMPKDAAGVPMVSSVSGKLVDSNQLLMPRYWADNMTLPVRFLQAVTKMCAQSPTVIVDHLVEVGPHATLQGPLRDILKTIPRGKSIGYHSILRRAQSATQTLLQTLGALHCEGYPVDLRAVNGPLTENQEGNPSSSLRQCSLLVDLPSYEFDHSRKFWYESRLSRNYRLRTHVPSKLLGVRSRDWNPSHSRWRHVIRLSEMPWIEQHVINNSVLYPGAGMLVMAIEASKQLMADSSLDIQDYTLRDVHIEGPMDLSINNGVLESQVSLEKIDSSPQNIAFKFIIRSISKDDWMVNCRGYISVGLKATPDDDWTRKRTARHHRNAEAEIARVFNSCRAAVDSRSMFAVLSKCGLDYGPLFQAVEKDPIRYDEHEGLAGSELALFREFSGDEDHVIHPVTLDALLRVSYAAFTAGGSRPMPTSIPSRIGCLWVSNEGLRWPDADTIKVSSSLGTVTQRGYSCSGGALSSSDAGSPGQLRLWFQDLQMTNVTSAPAISPPTAMSPEQFCMRVESQIALDKLKPQDTHSLLYDLHPPQPQVAAQSSDLCLLVELSLHRLTRSCDPLGRFSGPQEPWKAKYWEWAQHHVATKLPKRSWDDSIADSLYAEVSERLVNLSQAGRLYATVASNLLPLLNSEVTPLELLMQTGVLKSCYQEWSDYRGSRQAASYMKLLSHQKPGLRILEVGGGTAATTRNFLGALARKGGNLCCDRYDFTDVSSAFLAQAREEFAPFQSQMQFGVLDIERDLGEQGFCEGDYDVVVSDNVLHVPADHMLTLRNVRKALKPGGKLVFQEIFNPSGWTAGFVFGLFPGWWLGADNGRRLSPNISIDEWDAALKLQGFSGVDLLFCDTDIDHACHMGWIVTTAIEPELSLRPPPNTERIQATLVIDGDSKTQHVLSKELSIELETKLGIRCTISDFKNASATCTENGEDKLVILLMDCESPSFISSIQTETAWATLKGLIISSRRLLWVSSGGRNLIEESPECSMIDGLARTLRFEDPYLHLVTVALEFSSHSPDSFTSFQSASLIQIAHEMCSKKSREVYEQEYVEIEGLLHTRRLIQAGDVKDKVDAALSPHTMTKAHDQLRFEVKIAENEGTIECIQSALPDDVIAPSAVEIAVEAVSLRSRDKTAALGYLGAGAVLGSYCSAVVVRVGEQVSSLKTGDRVIAAHEGCYRSHIQMHASSVAKMPPSYSFEDACQILPPVIEAYDALIEKGRIRPSDSVLVYDGASAIGMAALDVLKRYQDDGDIWTTAMNEKDGMMITERTGIPESHILPQSWFEGNATLPLLQYRANFDAVFAYGSSTLATQSLPSCVKSGGSFVVLQHSYTPAADSQNLQYAPSNVSVKVVDGLRSGTPQAVKFAVSTLRVPDPQERSTTFDSNDLDGIHKKLRVLGEGESLVVKLDRSNIDVKVNTNRLCSLRPDATYVISGGLGGLGRELARWLATRGARYLILLSRSGPCTAAAQELVAELNAQGVHVEAPVCNVADEAALENALADCSKRMPLIRGCIQGAMVMKECIFSNLSVKDWRQAIEPKIMGSWNLHRKLPELDFFVLLSSCMGILGSGSLAAYNAGNTYQDTLAQLRTSQGQHAVAIDLGALADGGYLVDQSHQLLGPKRPKFYTLMYMRELRALLDVCCGFAETNTSVQAQNGTTTRDSHIVIGVRPPAHWKHIEDVPSTMEMPFWGHMHHIPIPSENMDEAGTNANGGADKARARIEPAQRLAAAASLSEAVEAVTEELIQRVSALLGTSTERLDKHTSMHSYGLDSLLAIELRNWVLKVFNIDIPIFEILGGTTFEAVAGTIAKRLYPDPAGESSSRPN
ncbi:putative polyketide synthase [Hypomontagnella monticulosa]|nr:putative polyketide synthase [Hypomontagnella monticulosa]